jgi:hypothetical protein
MRVMDCRHSEHKCCGLGFGNNVNISGMGITFETNPTRQRTRARKVQRCLPKLQCLKANEAKQGHERHIKHDTGASV